MLLKSLTAKADSLITEAKNRWISQIKEFASSNVVTVQEDKKVVDQIADLMEWKIDFVVVKDSGKVIKGVIGRDQLNDLVNEKRLEHRDATDGQDLTRMSFRDLIENHDLKEYYIFDENKESSDPSSWLPSLPAREVVIMKDKVVKAVVDRRWFRKWLGLAKFATYLSS
jgi:hypothetical protein